MSIGPMGIIGSAAGSPIAQSSGSEVERAKQDASDQQRRVATDKKAESAAGIGQTEEDQQASERDADGRRLWEEPAGKQDATPESQDESTDSGPRQSKDTTGQSGTQLDISG